MSIIYVECVFVALGISMQCACAILSSVACPAVQYFSTLSHKRHDKKKLLNEACVFSTAFICNIIGRIVRDMIKIVY
jgi:hypothetical protein